MHKCAHVNGSPCKYLMDCSGFFLPGEPELVSDTRASASPGMFPFVQPLFRGVVPSHVDGESGNKGSAVQ